MKLLLRRSQREKKKKKKKRSVMRKAHRWKRGDSLAQFKGDACYHLISIGLFGLLNEYLVFHYFGVSYFLYIKKKLSNKINEINIKKCEITNKQYKQALINYSHITQLFTNLLRFFSKEFLV